MASVFLSTAAETVVIDSRTKSGTITLPVTNSIPYRVLNFKDQYGSFSNSTLTISTQTGESFDDGTTTKTFSNAFSYLSLYATPSKWMVMNATQTVQQTISSLTVNQLTFGTGAGWVQFGPLQATVLSSIQLNTQSGYIVNPLIGNVSTVNAGQFYGLFGNYNNTALAEISTGTGTQELLVFKGSSVSDRIRFQTTGNFVVETGVSSRLWNSNTLQTLSNATPAFVVNTSSNVGIQVAPANVGATLDVGGTGRFQLLSTLGLNTSSIVSRALTTTALFTSSFLASTIATSTITTNSLVIGTGTGWVNIGPLQSVAISTQQENTNIMFTNTASTLALNISSINGLGGFPSAYVSQGRLSANQTITRATDTILPWVSDFDPYGWLQNAGTNTARVIPTVPGYYMTSFQVWWGTGTGTDQVNIQSRKNTATFAINQQVVNTVNGMTMNQTKIVYMNGTTDYLDFQAFTGTSGANQTIQAGGGTTGQGSFYSVSLIR